MSDAIQLDDLPGDERREHQGDYCFLTGPELLDSLEPMIAAIAQEYGRRYHTYGAETDDFHQQLCIWVLESDGKINGWLDPEQYPAEHAQATVAKALRNQAKDYAVDIKTQGGYVQEDLHDTSARVKALLPAVFDPERWDQPSGMKGRSAKSAGAGNNWVGAMSDVSRAVESLDKSDKDILLGFHRDGWNNKMMSEARGITESLMSYRHDRAVKRLVEALGDNPLTQERTKRDPWRGRHAISSAQARAITGSSYDSE